MESINFKIGDTIKVINPGQIYSTYIDMAKTLGADIDGRWIKRDIVDSDADAIINETGHILNICKDDNHILIQLDNGKQWIISPKGIKKIDFNYLPDELFEV